MASRDDYEHQLLSRLSLPQLVASLSIAGSGQEGQTILTDPTIEGNAGC